MPANNRILAEPLYQMLSLVAALWITLLLFTNLPLFFDNARGTSLSKFFYYPLFPAALLFALNDPASVRAFLKTPLLIWSFAAFAVIGANVVRLAMVGSGADIDIEIDRVQRLMIMPVIAYVVFAADRRWFKSLIPVAALIVLTALILDLLFPALLPSPAGEIAAGRSEGFFLNANAGAEAAILCCILMQGLSRRLVLAVFVTIAGAAVIATFSRSGMLMYVITCAVLFTRGRLPVAFLALPVALGVGFSAFSAVLEDHLLSIPGYEKQVDSLIGRLNYFNRDLDEVTADSDETERSDLAKEAFAATLERPLLGFGVEFRDDVNGDQPHNMVLTLWHLYGLAGVALWLGLIFVLWKGEPGAHPFMRLGALALAFFSIFSHNLYTNIYWLAFIALYLHVTASGALTWNRERGAALDARRSTGGRRRRRRRRHTAATTRLAN